MSELPSNVRAPPKLIMGVLVIAFGILGWNQLRTMGLERDAKKSALAPCVATGLSSNECEQRIDRGSTLCFTLNYTEGSRKYGRAESFNELRYRECAMSPSADEWSRHQSEMLRQSTQEEKQLHHELLGP